MSIKKRRCSSYGSPLLFLLLVVDTGGAPEAARAQVSSPLPMGLSQAIDLALQQNRNIQLARLSLADTLHKKQEQRAAYFPQIKDQSAILHITQLAGVEIPAGAFGDHPTTGPIPGGTLFIDQGALTSYTSGTGLEQPLTQLFKIHEASRAANADVGTARVQVSQTEEEIALKVRRLYYGILVTQLQQQAAAEEVRAGQLKMQESTEAVERGGALAVVALQSSAALLSTRQDVLRETLSLHDQMLELDDTLGLPLHTRLRLDPGTSIKLIAVPSREECIRMAKDKSPAVQAARQSVDKAKAGLSIAKEAYIPDVTGLARYSYQSGIPFLVHNYGTFGFSFSYTLFDGGRREAEIKDSRTLLSQAELNLISVEEEVTVQVETAYDEVEQLQEMVSVAEEVEQVSTEAARLADRQFEQNAALASMRADAHAKLLSAAASSLDAHLGLVLAQADLERIMGQIAR